MSNHFPGVASDKAILILCSEEGRTDPDLACVVFEWMELYYEIEENETKEEGEVGSE